MWKPHNECTRLCFELTITLLRTWHGATLPQALGQLGKAVEDLRAAAEVAPHDAEVSKQLTRMLRLLAEQQQQKQLSRLVSVGGLQGAA